MTAWGRGRGLLGPLKPLLGSWRNVSDDARPASRASCTRTFEAALGGGFVRLSALWPDAAGPGRSYEELALFGSGTHGALSFWSFTSDGKHSEGHVTDGSEVHPRALAFEAQMPAGLARLIYWPAEAEGFHFAVESRTKKGWNRFLLHHYVPLS